MRVTVVVVSQLRLKRFIFSWAWVNPNRMPSTQSLTYEIGFALFAVAEDFEFIGVFSEFFDEIDDHAMGASCADDVCEPIDPGLEVKGAAECADESFCPEFPCTIHGDR